MRRVKAKRGAIRRDGASRQAAPTAPQLNIETMGEVMKFLPTGADIGRAEMVCRVWREALHAGSDHVWGERVEENKANIARTRVTYGMPLEGRFNTGTKKEQYINTACVECGCPAIYELPRHKARLCSECADTDVSDKATFTRCRKDPELMAKVARALLDLNRMRFNGRGFITGRLSTVWTSPCPPQRPNFNRRNPRPSVVEVIELSP
ncbi:unnamed protein product [Vitrella brassicaformis CCMP3155]|uniref:F-box domain-containing protein n=1 Tax=Vitrella brassicaformis (strain CCMP3155) TaxID=1169540 RepID=A0A0G4GGT3_VITBC|nr:unnamed protein product [Vitrella brassicaformis CCMP3155]|eukprot:CEM28855.1 unnamed protein product [Vitrella brassicaformis CCMP3155]